MNEPTHFDGCAGFGGFSIAAEWAGFKTIAFCEVAEYANRVLAHHWPSVTDYGDLRECPDVHAELFTCGFPCPPFSIAGRRLGERDDRNLWPAVLNAIGRIKPDWCVLENVVNIKNMVLSRCLDELEERGYQHATFDIPSCAVGLPSVERHIWIVAASDRIRLERGEEKKLSRFRKQGEIQCFGGAILPATPNDKRMRDLPECGLLRTRKGIPHYVERVTGIGNAVPPPVAFQILKTIRELI